MVADTVSIDDIKKRSGCDSLPEYFVRAYGPVGSARLEAARRNFMEVVGSSERAWACA